MSRWRGLRAAIQDLDSEEPAYTAALFAESRELLDEGLGLFAYTYRVVEVEGRRTIQLGAVEGLATAPLVWDALASWGAENEEALARIYETGVSSMKTAMDRARWAGASLSNLAARFEGLGVGELSAIVGHEPTGSGVFLTAVRARRSRPHSVTERRAYERLAAELGLAVRLRQYRRRAQVSRLTACEHLVAQRLLDGASDKSIASELSVSLSTVSTFARRIRRKLGCGPGEEFLALLPDCGRGNIERRLGLFERLTASECDVASELLIGSSYAQIADRRGVSVRTVASQCAAIFRKCDVSGRREFAAKLFGK